MSSDAEKTNKKIITVAFLGAALLALITTQVLFQTLGSMFSVIERWRTLELVKHGVPLAVFVGVFAALQLNSKVVLWGEEVWQEIRKIVWPSRRDTSVTTTAVCVMVVVAGLCFAALDYVSSVAVTWIVK